MTGGVARQGSPSMPLSNFSRRTAYVLLCLVGSGCAGGGNKTADAQNATNFRSLFQPQISQLSTEQHLDEIPAKPRDEYLIRQRFAEWMENDGNQPVEAAKQYRQILAAKPKNVPALLGLARMDILAGRMEEAGEGLRRASKLAKNSPDVAATYGQYYAAQKNWDLAAESYNKAVRAKPDDKNLRYQLAMSLARAGKFDAAAPHFNSTVGEAAGHYNVALLLHDEGQLEEAERHLELALRKQPTLNEARDWLVTIRQEMGKADDLDAKAAEIQQASASSDDEDAVVPSRSGRPMPPRRPAATSPQQQEQLRNQQ
jgi:tetratricopeptide (TPR) repeat protein